jgi:hypothetical protein
MRIDEVQASPTGMELAAIAEFLMGRAEDTGAPLKISANAFINMARAQGISLGVAQLKNLAQQPPLNNFIANIDGDNQTAQIIFKGAEPEVDDSDITPDQARSTVDKMAKRAASKKSL